MSLPTSLMGLKALLAFAHRSELDFSLLCQGMAHFIINQDNLIGTLLVIMFYYTSTARITLCSQVLLELQIQ